MWKKEFWSWAVLVIAVSLLCILPILFPFGAPHSQMSLAERTVVAYHEAGHTVLATLMLPGGVLKATIKPGKESLGSTYYLMDSPSVQTKIYLSACICVDYGGRAAEAFEFGAGQITQLAWVDFSFATGRAETMILLYGMSDDPLLAYRTAWYKPSYGMFTRRDMSEDLSLRIDREIARITREGYQCAEKLISEHSQELRKIAEALLKYETLYAGHVNFIMNGGDMSDEKFSELLE